VADIDHTLNYLQAIIDAMNLWKKEELIIGKMYERSFFSRLLTNMGA
jgi:hypothetical protein